MSAPLGDLLIVDDGAPLLRSLGRAFRRVGWSTREAQDGEEAVAFILEGAPRVLLTDMRMPRMGGFELIQWLRASGYDDVRVVVLSGYHDHAERQVRDLGVSAVLMKPVELDVLRDAVQAAADEP